MATLLLLIIYLAFISLGLPDALLGSAWPVMQPDFAVPYSHAGLVSMSITGGTILSSILSSRLLRRYGTGLVTAVSVCMTALALLGFSATPSFWWLLAAAVPLGLGAGSVDAGLNAYVAEHYESRHMSWLHSFWGIGALSGPLFLSALLRQGGGWRSGYLGIAIFQAVLVTALFLSLPLWTKVKPRIVGAEHHVRAEHRPLFFPLKIRGVVFALLAFFFYCGVEATMGLWGGSFLFKIKGMDAASAATWVSLFYAAITLGRLVTGFVTYRVSNKDLIRAGGLVALGGILLIAAPLPLPLVLAGFMLVGLGCAPIFPCMLHETPARFGPVHAQAIMGFQMAVAYIGSTLLPPAFGFIASATSLALLPIFLLAYVGLLIGGSEAVRKRLARPGAG